VGADDGGGAALDPWQRQAVLAAASFLRQRFCDTPDDTRAQILHDALLEVIEPTRRDVRLQREMSAPPGPTLAVRSDRRARGRRSGTDRRESELGPPRGIERRVAERRAPQQRRSQR
jgi:hypothetical protein